MPENGFNNKLSEQIGGVSMAASLSPLLANIALTKCKNINCWQVDEKESYYVLC